MQEMANKISGWWSGSGLKMKVREIRLERGWGSRVKFKVSGQVEGLGSEVRRLGLGKGDLG